MRINTLAERRIAKILTKWGEIKKDELLELLKPYTEQEIDLLIGQQVDESGARNFFICEKDGIAYYVAVDTTQNIEFLDMISQQLDLELAEVNITMKIINHRRDEMNKELKRLYEELEKAEQLGDMVKWNLIAAEIAELEG